MTTSLDVDILVTGEGSSALKVVERHNPAMLILDHGLQRNKVPVIVKQIKSSWPKIRCIVLVNDHEGRKKVLDSGADLILIKGIPGRKVVAEIEKLIHSEGFDPLITDVTH